MKAVETVSAAQTPKMYSLGNSGGVPAQGSGKWKTASTAMAPMARMESPSTLSRDRMVAAMVTGASIRMAKGFSSPPVRKSRTASCRMS